jgi:hypothetical protein
MCLPVAAGLAIAAGVTSAAGQIMQGQQAKAQANYNASVAKENAKQEVDAYQTYRGQESQDQLNYWRRVGQTKGQQVASMAANGIDVGFGSAARVQSDTQMLANEDAKNLYSNQQQKAKGYLIDASNYTSEAVAQKMQGHDAVVNSYFGAASSILGAASQAASLKAKAGGGY